MELRGTIKSYWGWSEEKRLADETPFKGWNQISTETEDNKRHFIKMILVWPIGLFLEEIFLFILYLRISYIWIMCVSHAPLVCISVKYYRWTYIDKIRNILMFI